ncbi:hypothetical protein BN938_0237 [Mucinivorans hirudinis]|uniref:Uncharacterized protein n=1 Tax=Mucinivorans hirudinis TaxID=1433126 RepID=A0A060R9D8_9BACT|nr:hypothetical protein BN938_0237 [Mucinivorans hirudinis]
MSSEGTANHNSFFGLEQATQIMRISSSFFSFLYAHLGVDILIIAFINNALTDSSE